MRWLSKFFKKFYFNLKSAGPSLFPKKWRTLKDFALVPKVYRRRRRKRSGRESRRRREHKQQEEEEKRKGKQEEEGAQAGGDMEKLCSYIRDSCNLDSTEACEAVDTVKLATNTYEGMLQLMALMTVSKPGIDSILAYTKARTVFNAAHHQISKPSSSSSGSVTLSMSLPSEALDHVQFHTSQDLSHMSQDISSQLSSMISGSSSSIPATYKDWGRLALESRVDDNSFPQLSNSKVTETLWPAKQWDKILSQKTRVGKDKKRVIVSVETKFTSLIEKQKQRSKPRYVNFVFAKATGNLCAEKRPDFYLTRVGTETPTPEAVGTILFTQSTTQRSNRYDNDVAVREAIAVGQKFLVNTSKERSFIIVGVTNLKAVRWFKVCKSGSAFRYLWCSEKADVASSLAGYMCSSLKKLGLTSRMVKVGNIYCPLGRFLGEGHTSDVHVVTVNKEAFAVKVPKIENDLSSDTFYLEKLCGIKEIPIINQVYSTSIAVFTTPVCLRLTPDVLFKENLQHHLPQLVDTLKCAHERMVVHRDVRTENIMVADGLFVIVDWGYAATRSDLISFAGTTYFASARVLKLLEEGTATFAIEACDDLVSLVQSLSLLVRRNEKWRNKLYALSKTDYVGICKFWEEYFGLPSDLLRLAQNASYSELKNCMESWALSL